MQGDDDVLVRWLLINPLAVNQAIQWMKEKFPHKDFFKDPPSRTTMNRIASHLSDNIGGAPKAIILEQRAGYTVAIPPGWVFTRESKKKCIIIQVQVLKQENFYAYISSVRAMKRIGLELSDDCVGLSLILQNSIVKTYLNDV